MDLYYYTSTDTMRYILGKADIFATNLHYMNDSEEYINGLKEVYGLVQNTILIQNWNQRRKNKITSDMIQKVFNDEALNRNRSEMEYYSISFCEKNDLLSQWAIYAKESGVSIKMRFDNGKKYRFLVERVNTDSDTENNDKYGKFELCPEPVYYFTHESMDESDYEKRGFEILDKLYPDNCLDSVEDKGAEWRYISTFVKRYDFYQEAERRLVFAPNQVAYDLKIQYRPDKNVLKPYMDVVCEMGWPVWEIMIGPGFNQKIVYDSIKHFLNHAKIKNGISELWDYVERLDKYFDPCRDKLKTCKEFQTLQNNIENVDKLKQMDSETAIASFIQSIELIRKEIQQNLKKYQEVQQYFEKNYFTRSGIVLSRSSIPYIF